ncbi:MAG TPA: histidinol dehydrogenase, partial [Candidatus Synoicihabitans sp.]|nr:histidinol dehydrogenase [Candidatus Synoicihabitans sp.]
MRLLATSSKSFQTDLASFCRDAAVSPEIVTSVGAILADIRGRGDEAVSYYAAKFDGAKLRGRDFPVKDAEVRAAAQRLPAAEKKAMTAALQSIEDFNQRTLPKAWNATNPHGARVGEVFHPIQRVGLYVPGGEVPLVSSVLMTVALAKLAGCPEIVVCTPSSPQGKVSDGLLAALHLLGVTEIYRIGGVQAIGAMAYGTDTIRPVDKIFGPGNA